MNRNRDSERGDGNRWWGSHPSTISSFHKIKILSFRRGIQGLCGRMQQDMVTFAPHHSRHPKRIREEERFWLEEDSNSMAGTDRVPSPEEPHKLSGSMKSQYSHNEEPISSPTDLADARQDLRNTYHQIWVKEGDKYKTMVWAPSHAIWVDERTSYQTSKLHHKLQKVSRRQSNDL